MNAYEDLQLEKAYEFLENFGEDAELPASQKIIVLVLLRQIVTELAGIRSAIVSAGARINQ